MPAGTKPPRAFRESKGFEKQPAQPQGSRTLSHEQKSRQRPHFCADAAFVVAEMKLVYLVVLSFWAMRTVSAGTEVSDGKGRCPLTPRTGILHARLPSGELPKAKCQSMLDHRPSRHPFFALSWSPVPHAPAGKPPSPYTHTQTGRHGYHSSYTNRTYSAQRANPPCPRSTHWSGSAPPAPG